MDRRQALRLGAALVGSLPSAPLLMAQDNNAKAEVLNPRGRIPVSLIIDDSTCLVNLAHFCIPQFAEVDPDRYKQDWRSLPREIPDTFVREFGEWCHSHGVKGKYSVIPYPALVGWIDRDMPGWSHQQLVDSVNVVRTVMTPDWDLHPEMVTHTWAIDTKTGRPYPERSVKFMENWGFSERKSADELTDYLAYALRPLKNLGLPCEGITTPGGFGNKVLPALAQGTLNAVRDVFGAEIPHYFRHLYTDNRSVAPKVQLASGLDGPDPKCVVSIIGCTGDWFGGWDGLTPGHVDQFITEDGRGGRLPEVIRRGEPAIMVCHWPGIYYNGQKVGFHIFKQIVTRLEDRYDNLIWMKLSEIARYWAARELTKITVGANLLQLSAPFACPGFTVQAPITKLSSAPTLVVGEKAVPLAPAKNRLDLKPGLFVHETNRAIFCFDLPKGASQIVWS